ncbi:hypothetical protein [Parasedimentitalea huanghaiensis]|uniref:AAA+ family ATPase n=1 Tax=Parasedimentitalea huanghaiensis TaxID=2682100 RepID=A0A6L6WI21_9RHOB|nr:hypothetical protein [Zongyanglinia huanghaiensis]MVO16961.1 hypothetical protein [Zongyanglinia huanghaiensis]
MKQILPLTFAALIALPAVAQDQDQDPSLMEQGLELFWEGLRQEMAPTLDDMRQLAETLGPSMQGFLSEMGPALAEIANQVEDWSAYEMPEILPNGDIIIRKKPGQEQPQQQPQTDGQTDI